MRNKNLLGTGVALITPFNNDFSIDYDSLDNLIEYLIECGIDYFVLMGTTGEVATLTSEEQKHLLLHVKNTVNNRKPIVLGLGGNDTYKLINQISHIDFSGIEAILSVAPYYNKPSQQGLFKHYDLLASKSPVDIILYNVPSRTSVNIHPNTIVSLALKNSNIIGVKEASGDISQCMDLISKCPKDFLIISGDDKMTFPILSLGGVGVISVQAMAFPDIFSEMVRAALNNQFQKAKELHYELLQSVDLFYVDGNPSGIKEALYFKKICKSSQVRLPLSKMQKDNIHLLTRILKKYI